MLDLSICVKHITSTQVYVLYLRQSLLYVRQLCDGRLGLLDGQQLGVVAVELGEGVTRCVALAEVAVVVQVTLDTVAYRG